MFMHKEKESEMEPLNQRSTTPLERVVSQRALQMSNSFPCQICAVALFLWTLYCFFDFGYSW